jgi:peptidoglycan/LPS O-acetylase OafA/YrhL
MPATMQWSIALIGIAITGAGMVGAYLPRGDRWAVLLPLLAGAGVGIAVLALGMPEGNQSNDDWWQLFLEASVVGFLTVAAGLALLITRSNGFERRPAVPQIHD